MRGWVQHAWVGAACVGGCSEGRLYLVVAAVAAVAGKGCAARARFIDEASITGCTQAHRKMSAARHSVAYPCAVYHTVDPAHAHCNICFDKPSVGTGSPSIRILSLVIVQIGIGGAKFSSCPVDSPCRKARERGVAT